jgi:hypothetical protein
MENWFLFLLMYSCSEYTMKNALGDPCVKVVETYAPVPILASSPFGMVSSGKVECRSGGSLSDGACVKTRLVVEKLVRR